MATLLAEHPDRVVWNEFPEVLLHATIEQVHGHPDYFAAKRGDAEAAARLVNATMSAQATSLIGEIASPGSSILVSVHAIERFGTNAIPEAFARVLAERCELEIEATIVQKNIVNHTKASGISRLARQALFAGEVLSGRSYVIVDDFVGQGGTIANLRGFIEKRGGHVVLAVALTGKAHSVTLVPGPEILVRLRRRHGEELESWWQAGFGFGFDCLTASEARYLERIEDADAVRDRIVEAKQAGDLGPSQG